MDFFTKWNMNIIHAAGEGYRAILVTNGYRENEIQFGDYKSLTWKELSAAIERQTGIQIPKRKEFKFEKLSDFETIAGIDASHYRPSGSCFVTIAERKAGWMCGNLD